MSITYPVTYDGTDLDTDVTGQPRLRIRLVSGYFETWAVRGEDTIIPGAAGRVARNRVRDTLPIELFGYVMGTGASEAAQRADLEDAMLELRTLFDPTRSPATLTIALPDGGTSSIEARPTPNALLPGDDRIPSFRQVSIALEAVGDDWVDMPGGS